MEAIIYQITNQEEDCIYVGSTRLTLEQRRIVHECPSKKGSTTNLQQHVNHNGGWDNFSIQVLEKYQCLTDIELHKREKEWICDLLPLCNNYNPHPTEQETKVARRISHELLRRKKGAIKRIFKNETCKSETSK